MVMLLAAWLLGIQMGPDQNVTVSPAKAVVLEVTMPSGSVDRLTIAPGMHGSVGAVQGPSLDLSPTVDAGGTLDLVVTATVPDPATNSLSILTPERKVVQIGQSAAFGDPIFPISVKWIGTVTVPVPSGSATADPDAGRCCVVCGSELTCGFCVITPCGDCCAGARGCQSGAAKPQD